jgi:hypothetical protein
MAVLVAWLNITKSAKKLNDLKSRCYIANQSGTKKAPEPNPELFKIYFRRD